jgi:hypothetical protein
MSDYLSKKMIHKYIKRKYNKILFYGETSSLIYNDLSSTDKEIFLLDELNRDKKSDLVVIAFPIGDFDNNSLSKIIHDLSKFNNKKFLVNVNKKFNFSDFVNKINWLSIDIYNKKNQENYFFYIYLK